MRRVTDPGDVAGASRRVQSHRPNLLVFGEPGWEGTGSRKIPTRQGAGSKDLSIRPVSTGLGGAAVASR